MAIYGSHLSASAGAEITGSVVISGSGEGFTSHGDDAGDALAVYGATTLNADGSNYDFVVHGTIDNNVLLAVDASANAVGIGTASPLAQLHLAEEYDGGGYGMIHLSSTGDEGAAITLEKVGTVKYKVTTSTGNFIIYDETRSAYRMVITGDTAGNVGFGVADPDAKLEVFKAGTQLKLSYNASDNATFAVNDDGDLTITPSGGDVTVTGNLTVTGNTVTNQVEVISTSTGVLFEGGADDGHEATLKSAVASADVTYTLPNVTGYVPLFAADPGTTTVSATPAELNILDGVTATAAELNLIDGGTARGSTAIVDGDGVLINDGGVMRMTSVETLATYMESEIDSIATLSIPTELKTPLISFTDGDDAIAIADGGIVTISKLVVGSDAAGDVLYSNGTNYVRLAKGDDDQVLTLASGLPSWEDASGGGGGMTAFILEDDDGTEVSVSNNEEIKFIGSGITTNWTDTSPGSDADPFDLTFTVDAAQTGITSLLATDIKIGEDDQTKIDFETADEIHFYAANTEQVYVADNIFGPQSDSDVDLGSTGVRWKDAYVDTITVTGTSGGEGAIFEQGLTIKNANASAGFINFYEQSSNGTNVCTFRGKSAMGNCTITLPGQTGTVVLEDNTVTLTNKTITASGIIKTDDSTAATTTTDGSLQTDGGLSVVLDAVIGDDLILLSDSAVIHFGADKDTTLTHTDGTGLTLNSTNKLCFNDASQFIQGTSNAILALGATDEIDLTATLVDMNANLDLDGTANISGLVTVQTGIVPDAQDGAYLGTTSLQWSDLFMADAAVIGFGDDNEVTLTHVHNTGLLLNSTMQLQFNDASQFINAPSATVLDINATDEIELNATLVDINANVEISGTATTTGVHTFTAVPVFPNNTVETADIQDNAVTLAKMAGIARGKIIVGDSSGDPAALAVGSNGQVLTTDGTDVSWGSAGGSVSGDTFATDLKIGRDADNLVDFATTDNKLIFRVEGVNEVELVQNALSPVGNDGVALGTTSLGWSDLFLADAGTVTFGNDQDIILTHVADKGLTLSSSIASMPEFSLLNTNNDAGGARLLFDKNGANAADNDVLGVIDWTGENDAGSPETILYGHIECASMDVSDGSEDGIMRFGTMVAGTATTMMSLGNGVVTMNGPIGTGAACAAVLELNTIEQTVVADDVLGRIEFKAVLEGSGTDAITTAAAIQAEATATFAADNNSTDLVFLTGASAAATEKMRLSSAGVLTCNGGIVVDNITIDANAITRAGGTLTLDASGDIEFDAAGNDWLFSSSGTDRFKITSNNGNMKLLNSTNGTDMIFQVTSGNATTEVIRLVGDSTDAPGGSLVIGAGADPGGWTQTSYVPLDQVHVQDGNICIQSNDTDAADHNSLIFHKTDTNSEGVLNSLVDAGHVLGSLIWKGSDGVADADHFIPAAQIECKVGMATAAGATVPASNDMPGSLHFSTTPDGAAAVVERMVLDSLGHLTILGADASTGTAAGGRIVLDSLHTTVVDGDYLGRIEFVASAEASGTDAILTGAAIHAEASDTFAADNNKTDLVFSTGASAAATEKMRLDSGTPKLTIGSAAAEDTLLVFDGNAQDFRIGLDDGTDKLEFGVGATHGTNTAFTIESGTLTTFLGPTTFAQDLGFNKSIADEAFSGITAAFTAGEDLVAGECVYFKTSDSAMWKAVATAAATSRCVAMAAVDISANASGPFLLQGFLRNAASFPTYTIGGALYTPEAAQNSENVPEQAPPDSDGDFVQNIGWAVTADMVYFNPSGNIIEVA